MRDDLSGEVRRPECGQAALIILLITGGVAVILGLVFAIPVFDRYQARAYAENAVVIANIQSRQTAQLVKVEQQKADIRIVEAKGIAEAQRIINATLTDKYLQHEAIGAQLQMAHSPNHTEIYIPVGTNGLPLVRTVNP
ncbi:MAG TPA: hypothetical protein VGR71_06180 [Nitrospira sp.]|nr:hypothetical protein [Nitrospira sp.]